MVPFLLPNLVRPVGLGYAFYFESSEDRCRRIQKDDRLFCYQSMNKSTDCRVNIVARKPHVVERSGVGPGELESLNQATEVEDENALINYLSFTSAFGCYQCAEQKSPLIRA